MTKLIFCDVIKNARLFLGTLISVIITVAIISTCFTLVLSAKEGTVYGHRFEGVDLVAAAPNSIIIQYKTRDGIEQDEMELEDKVPLNNTQLTYLFSKFQCIPDYTFFSEIDGLKYKKLAGHSESGMVLSRFTIANGKRPRANEILIDRDLAAKNKIEVGENLTVKTNKGIGRYIVSGIVESNVESIYEQQNYLFFEDTTAVVLSNGCLNVGILTDDIDNASRTLSQKGFSVYTGKEINHGEVYQMITDNTPLLIIFLTMGALCLVISMFVISGTSQFCMKHRQRSLALLRVLGFTRGQIKLVLNVQNFVLCISGGVAGVLLGLPLTDWIAGLFRRINVADEGFEIFHSLLADGASIFATTFVVLIVTNTIANKSLAISPISALREEGEQDSKSTATTIILGSIFLLSSIAMLMLCSFKGRNGISMSFLTCSFLLTGAMLLSPVFMRLINWLMSVLVKQMYNSLGQIASANIKMKATRFAVASVSIAIMMSLNGVMLLNDITYLNRNAQEQYWVAGNYRYVSRDVSPTEIETADYLGLKSIKAIIRNKNHLESINGLAVSNSTVDIGLSKGKKSIEPGQIMLSQNVKGFYPGQQVDVWFPNGFKASYVVSGVFASHSDTTGDLVDFIINDQLALKNSYSNEYDFIYFNDPVKGSTPNNPGYYTDSPSFSVQMSASLLLVGISIMLSIIALYNTFAIIMSVRRREFNGLKVIGASKGQIFKMTLLETLIVVSTGMVTGLCIIVPVVGKFSIENLGVFNFVVDRQIFAGILFASAVLGLTAGLIPSLLTISKLRQHFRIE